LVLYLEVIKSSSVIELIALADVVQANGLGGWNRVISSASLFVTEQPLAVKEILLSIAQGPSE
jgi:hypothetical protein